ncbi:hypothetical protein [Polyangium sorediatum]|uniref:Nuclear transport factor 2 family protein n=1 Tax=Polyangium sorediatum TaxID=889274 RepID=A0ABT6NN13_9BACT|nr:hypothetical protein [Polyangium sorediatum]MDI1429676.1 hypothetical protein [Polyangium sorediatum]
MILSSSRSELPRRARVSMAACVLLFVGLLGCGGAGAPLFATTSELPEGSRRPDGVAVDPASAPPRARDVANAEAGLVTLRTPLGTEAVLTTVSGFFRAIVNEDMEALEGLFTRDALSISTTYGPSGSSPSAPLFWTQRMRRLDYTRLAGEVVFREVELEVYRAEDALTSSPHPAIRVEALSMGDVVVRVPITTSRVGSDRLLGEEVVLWLRREGERYRIYRLVEDFQMP